MSRHKCPAPECERVVIDELLACREHWYALPMGLRRAIWAAYRRDEVLEHRTLVVEAIAFWREHATP